MEAYLLYATVGQAFGKHAVYIMDTILKAEPADRCMLTFLYRHSDAHDINIYRSVGQKKLHKIILLYFTLLYFTLLYRARVDRASPSRLVRGTLGRGPSVQYWRTAHLPSRLMPVFTIILYFMHFFF